MDDAIRMERQTGVLTTAREEGLLGARDRTIGGRVPSPLVAAAKARSGIQSDSKVAVEDDFGHRLVGRKGRIARETAIDV
jgi:hypothetical protein